MVDVVIFHQLEMQGKDEDAPTSILCQSCSKSVHSSFEHTSAAIIAANAPPWLEVEYMN